MRNINWKETLHIFFPPILLALIFYLFYNSVAPKLPIMYKDEHYWIGNSYFLELFINYDFRDKLWHIEPSYDQPKLAEYMYGISLWRNYAAYKEKHPDHNYITFLMDHNFYTIDSDNMNSYQTSNTTFTDWSKEKDTITNLSLDYLIKKYGEGIIKTINLIQEARKINVLILSLSVLAVYYLSLRLSDFLTSLLTVLVYGFNKSLVTLGLLAQADGLFVLLFTTSMLFTLITIKSLSDSRTRFYKLLSLSIITSVLFGLLTSTKLNGIMTLFTFLIITGYLFLYFLTKRLYEKLLRVVILIFLSVHVTFLTFMELNPFVYSSPVNNFIYLYHHRLKVTQVQIKKYPQYYLPTFFSRISKTFTNFLWFPEYCQFSAIYSKEEKFCKTKDIIKPIVAIHRTLFFVGFITFLVGTKKKTKNYIERRVFLAYFVLSIFFIGIYLTLSYPRYFLHLIYFYSLFTIYGLTYTLKKLSAFIRYSFMKMSIHSSKTTK